MAQAMAEDGGRVPMSPGLQTTLLRAREYAASQAQAQVVLEHLLLALTEDGDAAGVLEASQIDLHRLRHDVAAYIGTMGDRVPPGTPGAPAISPQLTQVLKYATLAAQQGKRSSIDGAIVLAALVGDGRSMAASFLKAQGLTFEAAIRALKEAAARAGAGAAQPRPAPRAVPQPEAEEPMPRPGPIVAEPSPLPPMEASAHAEDLLAKARQRVESRAGPRTDVGSRPTTPAEAASESAPSVQPVVERGSPGTMAAAEMAVQQAPPQAPTHAQAHAPAWPAVEARGSDGSEPAADPQRAAQPPEAPERSVAGEMGRRVEPPSAQTTPVGIEIPRPDISRQRPSVPPPSPMLRRPAAPSADGAAPLAGPASQVPPQPPPHPALSSLPVSGPPPQRRPGPPPPATGAPPLPPGAPSGAPTSGRQPPSLPPATWPERGAEAYPGRASGPPPSPEPRTGWGGPQPEPRRMEEPAPVPLTRPAEAYRPAEPRPRGPAQLAARQPAIDASQVGHTIPGRLVEGRAQVIEVRIERPALTAGSASSRPHALRGEEAVARAITVRLRPGAGRWAVDATTPETQWDQRDGSGSGGRLAGDAAVWRFVVTPQMAGRVSLQLLVSARTLGADGILAETQIPDQTYDVRVSPAFGGWVRTAGLAGLWLIGGAVLIKLAEGLLRFDAFYLVKQLLRF